MSLLSKYEPQIVFQYFEEIVKVPHGSGNAKVLECLHFSFGE